MDSKGQRTGRFNELEDSNKSLIKEKMSEFEGIKYNIPYACFCLFICACIQISNAWSTKVISGLNGFGVKGLVGQEFYSISTLPGYS